MNPEDITEAVNSAAEEKEKLQKARNSSRSVMKYLLILFAAAFLLLLLTFFMQQRNHEAMIEDLHTSMGTMQETTDLRLENQQLGFQLESLQRELDSANAENEEITAELSDAQETAQALEWLARIEAAMSSSRAEAHNLIVEFEETGLVKSLPDESITGGESPADMYREIYAAVF